MNLEEGHSSNPKEELTNSDFGAVFAPKGVDLCLRLDIVIYSEGCLVDRIVMFTGDTDIRPAIKLARKNGTQIVGIDLPFGFHLPSDLKHHIDLRREISVSTIEKCQMIPVSDFLE